MIPTLNDVIKLKTNNDEIDKVLRCSSKLRQPLSLWELSSHFLFFLCL